jgi:D-alanine transaminase
MQLTGVAPIAFYQQDFLPFDQIKISPLDRGFIFGEGLYTTLACQEEVPLFLEKHLDRLIKQIDALHFPDIHIDLECLTQQLLKLNQLHDAAIYVHITRGIDKIRNHLPTAAEATVMMLAMPWIIKLQVYCLTYNLRNKPSEKVLRKSFIIVMGN